MNLKEFCHAQHSYISYNCIVRDRTALNTFIKTSAMGMCHLKILKILHFTQLLFQQNALVFIKGTRCYNLYFLSLYS
jgi:hypothetical protein